MRGRPGAVVHGGGHAGHSGQAGGPAHPNDGMSVSFWFPIPYLSRFNFEAKLLILILTLFRSFFSVRIPVRVLGSHVVRPHIAPASGSLTTSSSLEVGPHRDPPSVQQYQTHIFAPPVTGAPIKKNKSVPASQLVTLGPGGVIVSGGVLHLSFLRCFDSCLIMFSYLTRRSCGSSYRRLLAWRRLPSDEPARSTNLSTVRYAGPIQRRKVCGEVGTRT